MIKRYLLASALLSIFAVNPAEAETADGGTVDFTGTVVPSACKISTDTQNLSMDLGEAKTGELRDQGHSGSKITKSITLEGCPLETLADISFADAKKGSGEDAQNLLTNTGNAQGVGVKVWVKAGADATEKELDFSNDSSLKVAIQDGKTFDTKLNIDVTGEMTRIGQANVTAGNVASQLTYTISYK